MPETKPQFTKGPWKTGREDMQSYDGATGEPFTNIYHETLTDGVHLGNKLPLTIGRAEGKNNKANARLIAAAPELYEVCKLLEAAEDKWANCPDCEGATSFPELCAECFPLFDEARLKRRAAIEKAESR